MRPRLGHIQFLNCLPLYYGLVKYDVLLDVDLVKAPPRRPRRDARRRRARRRADPRDRVRAPRRRPRAPPRHLDLLATARCSRSCCSRRCRPRSSAGSTVALTDTSRTSQVLARILLAKHWGVQPDYVEMPPDLASMLREADAALLIGDDALRAYYQPTDLLKYDLGAEWKA